jgi:hypothetical protein
MRHDDRFFEKCCALSFPIFAVLLFIVLIVREIFFK